jgi:hypothetical protein
MMMMMLIIIIIIIIIIIMSLQSLEALRLFFSSFSTEHICVGWGIAPRPTSNVEDQCILFFVCAIAFGLSGKVGPSSSYTNASIALRIIWTTQDPLLRPSWDINGGTRWGGGASSRQQRWTRCKISEGANNDQKHVYAYFVIESVLNILNIPSHANKSYVKERTKQICYQHRPIPGQTLCFCKWYDLARLVLSIL